MQQWPALHADSHRPVGFLGPDDQGGSDPLPLSGIREITSGDGSITILDGTGPVVDVAVNQNWTRAYDTITVPTGGSGTSVTVDWNNLAATGLLDASTLNTPKFVNTGPIIVTLQVSTNDVFTNGLALQADLQSPAPIASFPDLLLLLEAFEATTALPKPNINMCGGRFAGATEGIQLVLTNYDSIDHTIFWRVDIQQIVGAA